MTAAQKQNLIQGVRQNLTEFAEAIDGFRALEARLTALEADKNFKPEDFIGVDEGITPEELLAGIQLVRGVLNGLPGEAARIVYRLSYK